MESGDLENAKQNITPKEDGSDKPTPLIVNVSPTPINVDVRPASIELPVPDDTQAQVANRLTKVGIVINTLLFIITLLALLVTWRGLRDSEIKDEETRKAQRVADSINHVKDSLTFRRDTLTISLAQKSLEAQLDALKETHTQFEIENRPIIQITNFNLDAVNNNKRIYCEINNIGKLPARILKCSFHIRYLEGYADFVLPVPYNKREQFHFEQSLYNNASFPLSLGEEFGATEQQVSMLAAGRGQIWFFGEVEYLSSYTKKKFRLRIVTVLEFINGKLHISPKENEDILMK